MTEEWPLAYIPSPIFFGQAIDQACLLWSQKCGGNGSCLLYDIVRFRYSYVGIATGLKVVSLCFFVALWFIIRKRTLDDAEMDQEVTVGGEPDNEECKENHNHHALDFPGGGGGGVGREDGHSIRPPQPAEPPLLGKPDGETALRPSHLPIPIYSNKQHPHPPRISHSAPVGQPIMDGQGQQLSHSLFTDGHHDPNQEVMVMSPGSVNLQSLPLTATSSNSVYNEESIL